MTANVVINATQPILDERPEPFNRIRMCVANDVNFFRVVDSSVPIVAHSKPVIRRMLIRKDYAFRHDVFTHDSDESIRFYVIGNQSADAAFTFDHSNNRSLFLVATHAATGTLFAATAVIHLINFYLWLTATATKFSRLIFVQHGANLFKHAPCGLVSNTCLPLNLLCRDTAPSRSHEIGRVEPCGKRGGRLVEDRASGRVNVMTAIVARIRWTADYTVMLRFLLALVTKYRAFWIETAKQPLKTDRISRELAVEVFLCVLRHFRLAIHELTYLEVKYA